MIGSSVSFLDCTNGIHMGHIWYTYSQSGQWQIRNNNNTKYLCSDMKFTGPPRHCPGTVFACDGGSTYTTAFLELSLPSKND